MNIQFGSGVLFGKPVAGNLPTNPTPFRFGVIQEATVDFKADLKKLYGQNQFPVASARGKVNVDLKMKVAVFDPNLLNQLFFSQSSSTGVIQIADQEATTIPSTPYQITVTNAAQYVASLGGSDGDFGVQFAATGQQLIRVVSAPTTGQYSVNVATGVYTFAAADTTKAVLISYAYTVAGSGVTIPLTNQLMGFAPEILAFLYNNFRAKWFGLSLFDVTLGEISIPSKLEDFWIIDVTGSANANASNSLGALYMANF